MAEVVMEIVASLMQTAGSEHTVTAAISAIAAPISHHGPATLWSVTEMATVGNVARWSNYDHTAGLSAVIWRGAHVRNLDCLVCIARPTHLVVFVN